MASLAQRLTFWLRGDSPPQVPHPEEIRPIVLEARLMLNLKMPSVGLSDEDFVTYVNSAVTDEELQAHGLQAMKDQLGWTFDRALNPNMPEPKYYRPKPEGSNDK